MRTRTTFLNTCAAIAGVATALLPLLLPAQTANFIHYGVEHGLTQTQVQTLDQDNEGNLWIGTMAGLTRYDGRTFKAFRKDDGLAEDWITASLKDDDGNMWFGHWGGGVSQYDQEEKKIKSLNLEQFGQFKTITSIYQDTSGRLWFGTEGYGIYIYDGTDNIISLNRKSGLASDNIQAICRDNSGNIWIGTDKGLTVYDPRKDIGSVRSFITLDMESGLPGVKITHLVMVNGHELWVGTETAGVIVLNLENGLILINEQIVSRQIMSVLDRSSGLASNNVQCIFEDREKNVWIGTRDAGVTRYSPTIFDGKRQGVSQGVLKTFSIKQGLNYYRINTVMQDRENNIWIGTDIGLNQYRGEMFQIFDEEFGLVNNIVWSILHDRNGNVWVGTNGGVSLLPAGAAESSTNDDSLFINYTVEEGLPGNVVHSLHEDNYGNIWIGTSNGGACMVVNGDDGKRSFRVFNKENGLADNTVYAINSDHRGNIWFGTREGATMFNPDSTIFTTFTSEDGLGGNKVYSIYKDSKGTLWFGILGGYLTHYDGYEFKTFDESDGIKNKFILCITEDESNNIWFGAYGGGLYRFDGEKFNNFSTRDGLTSDSPYLLVCDDYNNLWIGTSQGIDKYDQKNKRFSHYGKQEGFLGIETNRNAVYKEGTGEIWFGTIMGAVKYNPNRNKTNSVEPIIRLHPEIKLFHRTEPFPDEARFDYDKNHLTFTFTGVSLTNPEKVRYKFMLEGYDRNWGPEVSENYAMYPNLPPGTYTFKVISCNNDKIWNKEAATYGFTILTPFWQAWWFYAACIVTVLSVFYLIVMIRTRNLQRIRAVLEEQVSLRTRQLQQKNKDITDSIRYAKRIQEAIMPSQETIRRVLPESVVFYKPKDIVSGDFYWVDQRKDKVLFAAVDCTGHGVPGAFMSIVGHNILKNAVNEHAKTEPAAILDEMNRGVSDTLKQTYEESSVKDGMDIALCALDRSSNELEFAGAYNALYHIRDGRMSVIKGDKCPIGIFVGEELKRFTNHKITLQKGDMIYIASDGYADQFGGPKGKKFKYQRFQDLLLDICRKDMKEQYEALNSAITSWMGDDYEQVDDILVLGVKV